MSPAGPNPRIVLRDSKRSFLIQPSSTDRLMLVARLRLDQAFYSASVAFLRVRRKFMRWRLFAFSLLFYDEKLSVTLLPKLSLGRGIITVTSLVCIEGCLISFFEPIAPVDEVHCCFYFLLFVESPL